MAVLKFAYQNSKIRKLANELELHYNEVASFDIPAGHTCPFASLCLSKADKITGKITDGKDSQFRCYAASSEAAFPTVRALRWHNFDLLKPMEDSIDDMVELIEASLPNKVKVIRIHSSGDFFHKNYFKAWVRVAKNHPEISFFGYTKGLPYVDANKSDNFSLVYSFGGKMDSKLSGQPTSYVVPTMEYAYDKNLPVSCIDNPVDDYYRVINQESFALLLHGTQKAGGATMK